MSTLLVRLDLEPSELNALAIPVEVRLPSLRLVARTTAGQLVELEPGTYYVVARLPGGQRLSTRVDVPARESATAVLAPEPEDHSRSARTAASHFLKHLPTSSMLTPDTLPLPGVPARLRAWRGNALVGANVEQVSWAPESSARGQTLEFTLAGDDGIQIVQLLQPGRPATNVLVPAWRWNRCRMVLAPAADGGWSVDVELENLAAELLLRYFERGLLQQAAAITDQPINALEAEDLLFAKREDPVSAAVGAYALLRLGDLPRLHNWTENLRIWFRSLADGLAIRAEHLARLGEHAEGCALLLELPQRGLPLFADGLSYSINRLRLYATSGSKTLSPTLVQGARALLPRLERFATFTDFSRPVLTFTGVIPAAPDAVPVSADVAAYGGLEVREYRRQAHA